jgi:hypothetical protein
VKFRWNQLGGKLGIGLALLGFVLIFLGWNGAASYDRVPAQFPYLVSGGIAGLALVVIGAAAIVVQAAKADRAALQRSVDELRAAVERLSGTVAVGANGSSSAASATSATKAIAASGLVVAGGTSYHRPDCRLVDGRGPLPPMTVEAAEASGLTPCRACDAADVTLPALDADDAPAAVAAPRKAPARRRAAKSAAPR